MKYKVGDKVKIKTWAAMAEEFGEVYGGPIPINEECYYTPKMECEIPSGRIVTIERIEDDGRYVSNFIYGGIDWILRNEMIEGKVSSVSPRMKAFKKRPYRNAVK